jgi:anaerobic selenocysteine-containing dehydrogenase
METVYDPLRLRGPLKRVGKRGEGKWVSISWDQAMDEIATRLKEYRSFDPIDPNYPELGPKANQVVFAPGRYEHGQKEFTDRFWAKCYGTINKRHDHTSICEESHHIAGYLMTEWKKNHFKPDIANAEFIIWWGSNPLEAGFPMQALARKVMDFKARGGKMAVVDPRFAKTAAHADYWVPVKPGGDAALALGIARWMVDNDQYDSLFLSAPSKAAANANDEASWTDATYLVNLNTKKFVRPADVGLSGEADDYVVSSGGSLSLHSEANAGDLEVTTEVDGVPMKSVFQLILERLRERTIEEYAELSGIEASMIIKLAQEFAAHGKKSVANPYRGPCQHTNGTYTVMAIHLLNLLAGNFDWKVGNSGGGSHYHEMGNNKPGQVAVANVPNGVSASGIQITRVKSKYDEDAPNLFQRDGIPARRPWFPFGTLGNFQEIFPSINDQYPYPVKALIAYWANFPYSTPAQRAIFEKTAADESKLPLFVVFDIRLSETAQWADYVLPDSSILERWSTPHVSPAMLTRTSGWRHPVVGSFDGKPPDAPFDPNAENNYEPILPGTRIIEDVFIDLGKRMGLPGVGDNAFEDGSPLHNAWDWYWHMANNIAIDRGVSIEDVVARGGAFEDPGTEYSGDKIAHQFKKILHLYSEELATTIDSMTGNTFDPIAKYEPIKDVLDQPVDNTGYPFVIINYKPVFHAQARTINNPSLVALMPTNWVEMAASDGEALGLESGEWVKVVAPDGTIEENARVRLTEGMRPGVIAVAHSYGHWEMGSKRSVIDGKPTKFDATRSAGITVNPIMRVDPVLGDVSLQDKIGASVSFSNTYVRIEKV